MNCKNYKTLFRLLLVFAVSITMLAYIAEPTTAYYVDKLTVTGKIAAMEVIAEDEKVEEDNAKKEKVEISTEDDEEKESKDLKDATEEKKEKVEDEEIEEEDTKETKENELNY